jgi:dolichyl-phosphate-mannose--protein O-mannosyl transferase
VDYLPDDMVVANIYNLGNPALLWMGLAAVVGLIVADFKQKKLRRFRYERIWVLAYFGTWLPWLISPRIMFFYHYAPAVPFLGLSLAALCTEYFDSSRRKWLTGFVLLGVGICFVWFLPIWLGWPLTETALQQRLLLPTWK